MYSNEQLALSTLESLLDNRIEGDDSLEEAEIEVLIEEALRPLRPYLKTTGIKVRGVGCATKGTMARGPMA